MEDMMFDRENAYDKSLERVFKLLEEKKYFQCRDELLKYNEVEIAEILDEVIQEYGTKKAVILFRTLPKDISVEVFAYLDIDDQVAIINQITDPEIEYIIDELDFDDMIDVLEELPANIVDKILSKATQSERKLINTFLNYKENSAGSLMTPDYINISKTMTVQEALQHIKDVGMDSETVYTCYVLDGGRKLIGIVSLRSLVIADGDTKILDLMEDDIIIARVDDDQEEVADAFKRYGFLALPVVDNEGRLVGIITFDDIMDVIEEETQEDIERMAGVIDTNDKGYLEMSVYDHVKARLPWLFILMCSYMVTGGIIQSFEDALSEVISLVTYMPMLMGTGGNSGTQASTLVIRGMATGDIEDGDALSVLWNEFRVSIVIGVCVSLINVLRILFIDGNGISIAMTVSFSMMFVVVIAKCFGGMLPIAAKKVGVDPALVSGPLMASLTDMISLVIYFATAKIVLGI